jgi:hypothetical protein
MVVEGGWFEKQGTDAPEAGAGRAWSAQGATGHFARPFRAGSERAAKQRRKSGLTPNA